MDKDSKPSEASKFFNHSDTIKSLFVDFMREVTRYLLSKAEEEKIPINIEMWAHLQYDGIMLAEKFIELTEEFIVQGILLGEAKGLTDQKTTLLEMLAQRFGEIPIGWKKKIKTLYKPTIISRLTIAVLTVNSPEEYENLLFRQWQD